MADVVLDRLAIGRRN